jgi:hypothetical protein
MFDDWKNVMLSVFRSHLKYINNPGTFSNFAEYDRFKIRKTYVKQTRNPFGWKDSNAYYFRERLIMAMSPNPKTGAEFEELVIKTEGKDKKFQKMLYAVGFFSKDCPACKGQLKEKFLYEYCRFDPSLVTFVWIETTQNREAAKHTKVTPYFIFYKNGAVVEEKGLYK